MLPPTQVAHVAEGQSRLKESEATSIPRSELAREELDHGASGFLRHQIREVHKAVFSRYDAKQKRALATRQNLSPLRKRTAVHDSVCHL
jgi:hypothetical protein